MAMAAGGDGPCQRVIDSLPAGPTVRERVTYSWESVYTQVATPAPSITRTESREPAPSTQTSLHGLGGLLRITTASEASDEVF